MQKEYKSFGNIAKLKHNNVINLNWSSDRLSFLDSESYLAFGAGRSYGDSCLNQNGILIDLSNMNKFISFDKEQLTLECEAGTTFKDILEIITPNNLFFNTTPGTKYLTLGGAIANDVHGKNHFHASSFGSSVLELELLRSDGKSYLCSMNKYPDLFKATIGGLGLTGIITKAKFRLDKIPSLYIKQESIKFTSLTEFFEINEESEEKYEFTVSWIDPKLRSAKIRGIYLRGNYAYPDEIIKTRSLKKKIKKFPFRFPLINKTTINFFNYFYYHVQSAKKNKMILHYDNFFYPLDNILNWNNAYGRKGFYQYQFVIPMDNAESNLKNILNVFNKYELNSFLTVLKSFGEKVSPGLISFPKRGITLAIDFPASSKNVILAMNEADRIVINCGGSLYPAKDARMSPFVFRNSFPNWKEFSQYIDPKFSSSFWQRVSREQ